jgi:phosphoribosylanthranilate isomerase
MSAIKFCGITRRADARKASELGAGYVGAILTESARRISPRSARDIYREAGERVRGVAVFRDEDIDEIAAAAEESGASIVQVHRAMSADDLSRLRSLFDGDIWTVVDVSPGEESKLRTADTHLGEGVLIDASVAGKSGGTGKPLDWQSLSSMVTRVRAGHLLIVAGGLNPSNVSAAIASLGPDVVDVSSGVESSPGMKDPVLMEQFANAVKSARFAHP